MSDEQQLLGEPYEVEWRGNRLRFGGVVEGVKARCVAAAKLAAVKERDENLSILYSGDTDEAHAARRQFLRAFEDDMITGRWKWGGDLQEKWRSGSDGLAVFIGALLEVGGTPMTRSEIETLSEEKQAEIQAIILLCLWDINSPNRPRPAPLQAMTGLLTSPKSTASSAPNAV